MEERRNINSLADGANASTLLVFLLLFNCLDGYILSLVPVDSTSLQ